ncbi:hypothetical protein [Nocardia gipuzkoensis]
MPGAYHNFDSIEAKAAISRAFVKAQTTALGEALTVDRIRSDRILHEALTAGPDPLHLTLVFGISHNTARYGTARLRRNPPRI